MGKSKNIDPRARIMEAAEHLFYTEGIRATGTERIMSVSDVAKATFYRHFESKDALVLAYLDRSAQAFWDYLLSPVPPQDVREALIRIDRHWTSFRRSQQVALDSMRMASRAVLITGASSGVGLAASLLLAEQGAEVVMIAVILFEVNICVAR